MEKRRPPVHIRPKLDYRVDIKGNEVVIMALRPYFQDKKQILELPFVKMKWVNTRKVWRLYWGRANGDWDSYEPFPEGKTMKEVLVEVERDVYGCFFG